MRKSTKVKKTKVSKPVASTKKLKKFTNGGGNDIGTLKPKTPLEAAKDLKVNPTIATAKTLEEQKASSEDLMKGLMRPPTKEKETVVTAPKLESKTPVKSPKAKLLPGGFTSEAQRKAYTESLRQKIKSGKSVDQLVKEGYGTRKGLSDLGLGKYSEGLDLKKKGQTKKAEGLTLKNKAKNTDYKKQWNDNLLNKAASNKNLTTKEFSYIRQKYGKDTDWRGIKKGGTSKEKLAYKNAGKQQLEKLKPEMRENLETAVSMMTPRGIVKQAVKKGGEFVFSKGAKEYIKNAGRNLSEPQKLLGQGANKVANETTKKVASKTSLKWNANRLQARSRVNRAQKEGLEGITKTKDVVKNSATKTKDVVKNSATKTKDPIKGAKDLARNQRSKVNRTQKGGLEKILKKSDKVVKSKKTPEETILGRTKSQVDAFQKRNQKAYDNDWAIIDSYRRGGKAKTAKKTVAKVSVMRRGSKK